MKDASEFWRTLYNNRLVAAGKEISREEFLSIGGRYTLEPEAKVFVPIPTLEIPIPKDVASLIQGSPV